MTYPYKPNPDADVNGVGELEPEFEGLISDEDLDIINRKQTIFESLTKKFTCEMGKVILSLVIY